MKCLQYITCELQLNTCIVTCNTKVYQNNNFGDLLGGPVVRTLLPLPRVQVQSLVWELRSHHAMAQPKNFLKNFLKMIFIQRVLKRWGEKKVTAGLE